MVWQSPAVVRATGFVDEGIERVTEVDLYGGLHGRDGAPPRRFTERRPWRRADVVRKPATLRERLATGSIRRLTKA